MTSPGRRAIKEGITPDQVRDALSSIPPDVDRDTWVRIAMAVKAGLGDSGFDLWDVWSQKAEAYNATDARDTWRSVKAHGKVTVGTLFRIAKEHGFRLADTQGGRVDPSAQLEAKRQAEERARKREQEEAEYRARADRAARDAADLWDKASEQGRSPYLERKGVRGHDVRYLADGTLLVPLRNSAGELQNLQRIAPQKPTPDEEKRGLREKRFLPGGRKTGLCHWIGSPQGAPALLLAEGYATAATLHEATGRPVAVAFDAGNLVHVAKECRRLHADALILVCGDDDQATEARTGKNPGREKAFTAARACKLPGKGPRVAFPQGLQEGESDFNDLAQRAGLDAVRAIIDAALDGEACDEPQEPPGEVPGGGAVAHQSATGERDPFVLDDDGVWYVARDAEGHEKRPVWLCSRLHVAARTRADDLNGWGVLLEFNDPDGNDKAWAMPASMLSGDSSEWAARLRDMGLRMAPGSRARNLVAQYIDTRNPQDRVTCTDRVGWHGPVYVLPSGSIGQAEGRRYVFQSESGMEDTFRRAGTLAQWQASVATPCVGNSRLVFALCCAFAGPMLRLAELESGGFHLRGDSSKGKTTALRVAASVWGRPSYMQRWRTTDNALEATAVQHCDGLLILDEFGQLDPRVAGECAYMLANEQEKGRATRGGLARKRRTWRLLFLSSGELSLAQHMEVVAKTPRAGQEVRMLDVPLEAGAGMGGLETLHGHSGPAALADAVVSAAARFYGQAGRAWLEWACEHHATLPARLQALVHRYRDELMPEAASEQVRRAASRFALVAAAGELASQAGITAWPQGEALRGLRKCFNDWLAARGHLDNGEDAAMLRQVRRFLETNGEGRFTWWHRAADDHSPKTLNRAGFRRLIDESGKPIKSDSDHMREYGERISAADNEHAQVEYIVLREVFRRELSQGYDPEAVAALLKQRGHLVHERDRLTAKQRLPGIGLAACYQIKPSIFADEL